jgi:GPN-loop GTPase
MIQFVSDVTKYISGCMASLSAMIQLELPHINILSKMDLISNKKDVEEYVLFLSSLAYVLFLSSLA